MIELKKVNGDIIDLTESKLFVYHYNNPGAYAKFILDNEINNGQWYDELLADLPFDAVIVDVGMNVGLFSLYLGNHSDRKFYCVEPSANHISVAADLFEKFGYDYQIFKGVIYNKNGMVRFFEEPQNTTSNRVGNDGNVFVEAITLKKFFDDCKLEEVDLLKLDCEGAERFIILHDPTVEEALKKCKVIFVETHTGDGTVYMTLEEKDQLIEKVKSFGFDYKIGNRHDSHYFIKQSL